MIEREGLVSLAPVAGWGMLPGQAAYFSAMDNRGRLLIANEPQTDSQTQPTATTMAISIFDPATGAFSNVVVPTSTGATSAVALNGSGTGGADVSDLQLINSAHGQRLVVVSSSPYNGWDPTQTGQYPTLSVFADDGETWQPTAQRFTGDQIRQSSRLGSTVCGRNLPTTYTLVSDCGGLAEIGALPGSGLLVATSYLGDQTSNRPNGGLAVLDVNGVVVASLNYPSVVVNGRTLHVHPRELDVDPTSITGDERFLVIFDVDADGSTPSPFMAQEFSFDAERASIRAISAPFTTGAELNGIRVGAETASYDHDGNLWLAEARSNSLEGGRLVRYGRTDGRLRLAGECSTGSGDTADRWGATCRPDQASEVTSGHGLVRSLTEDVRRHRMLAVTTDGTVAEVSERESRVLVRLPLDALIDRNLYWIGPRKGSIDNDGLALWIPIQQLRSPALCPSGACPPATLDQWLMKLDLTA